jgi:PAS domain S-box-containing protein
MDEMALNGPGFFQKILDVSPVGICVLDSHGQFVFANSRAREIVGLQRDEMTQRYYHSPEWELADVEGNPVREGESIFERVRESGEPLRGVRLMVRRPDGHRIILSVNAVPFCDDAGSFNGIIAAYEDITQRIGFEELTDHAERLEHILASIPIGVQLLNAEGLNLYANRRAQEILGLSFDEITRRYSHSPEWHLTDMDGNALKPEDRIFARIKESHQPLYDQKLMVQRPDEHWIAISVNAQPLFDESRQFSGLASVYEDITERVLLERELRRHHEHLEETVRQRTLRLQELNQQLSREIELREEREKELESANRRLQALSVFVQSARERERSRSAFRVHDEIGQNLMVLQMELKGLEKDISAGRTSVEGMGVIYALMKQMLAQVYNISAELRPPILDDVGLGAAVEWQAQEFEEKTGIACAVEQGLEEVSIDIEVSTAVFRIFQEILGALALQAETAGINVRMSLDGGWLTMTVRSDGLDGEDLREASPLPFDFVREYAKIFGGEVGIMDSSGKGADIVLRIPA